MNLEIKKIRLNELEDFVNSKTFREFEFIPISPIRAKSYLANPHAKADDVVLFLGFIENKLVAFRSLFAGVANSGNEQIRFGWCSGNWVHPNYRRLGFSELLLKEAYIDWNQKLMFTNYAPNSEKLYIKTGWFKAVHQFNGVRAYLFPRTRKLVAKANSNLLFKLGFSIIDVFITLLSTTQLAFYRENKSAKYRFDSLEFPDEQCYESIRDNTGILQRGKKELRWIFSNPWISSESSKLDEKYPFSAHSKAFYYKTIKVFSNNNFLGFLVFSIREGHLKTLYWQLPNGIENEIAHYLKYFCKLNTIEVVSIYKNTVAAELFERKFPFLHVKKYGQKIYSTFELKNIPETSFLDGDGDVIFT